MRNQSLLRRGSSAKGALLHASLGGKSEIKAEDLVSKLRLLYHFSMTAFMHHIDRSSLKESSVVGLSHAAKHEADERM